MADDKEPMQADGSDLAKLVANENDPPSAGRPDMQDNEGQSGGGAYPNPHNDPDNADPDDGFMGHGGQSDMTYFGGADEAGKDENAVTKDED